MSIRRVPSTAGAWLLDHGCPPNMTHCDSKMVQIALHLELHHFKDAGLGASFSRLEIREALIDRDSDLPGQCAGRFWGLLSIEDSVVKELIKTFGRHQKFTNPVFVANPLFEGDVGCFFKKFGRGNGVKSLIIQGFGKLNAVPCNCCESRWAATVNTGGVHSNWPFFDCVSLPGYFGLACGNCIWHEEPALCCHRIVADKEPSGKRTVKASSDDVALVKSVLSGHVSSTKSAGYKHPLRDQPETSTFSALSLVRLDNLLDQQRLTPAGKRDGSSEISNMLFREYSD